MDPTKKLIVQKSMLLLTAADKIIANPNCSTIQMVLVLAPLHKNTTSNGCFNIPIHHWNRS
jgi:aspartate-semialdehyde dehydrogenase